MADKALVPQTKGKEKPVKTRLDYGLEYEGRLHSDFELRLPMVADNVAAVDAVTAAGLDPMRSMYAQVALFACCLTRLGDIPKEAITFELLNSQLVDEDYDILEAALADLRKKRREQNRLSCHSGG